MLRTEQQNLISQFSWDQWISSVRYITETDSSNHSHRRKWRKRQSGHRHVAKDQSDFVYGRPKPQHSSIVTAFNNPLANYMWQMQDNKKYAVRGFEISYEKNIIIGKRSKVQRKLRLVDFHNAMCYFIFISYSFIFIKWGMTLLRWSRAKP